MLGLVGLATDSDAALSSYDLSRRKGGACQRLCYDPAACQHWTIRRVE
jgi:hypothetical protein